MVDRQYILFLLLFSFNKKFFNIFIGYFYIFHREQELSEISLKKRTLTNFIDVLFNPKFLRVSQFALSLTKNIRSGKFCEING